MYANRQFWQWHKLFLIGLTLALSILVACGSGTSTSAPTPVLGHETEFSPEQQVKISCTTACAQRGQCGTAVSGSQVVLGGNSPMVENHDRLFPADTAVTIISSSVQKVERIVDGEQSDLRFYQIKPDDQPAGWVAGWCLAAQ